MTAELETTPNLKADLRAALVECGCIQYGDFTLASGLHSPYYFDLRRGTLDGRSLFLMVQAIMRIIAHNQLAPDFIIGPALGANPLVPTLTYYAFEKGLPYKHGSILAKRNTLKEHFDAQRHPPIDGTDLVLLNIPQPSDRVLFIEDTMTSGGSVHKLIACLTQRVPCAIEGVLCVVNRGDRQAQEKLLGTKVYSIFEAGDLLAVKE